MPLLCRCNAASIFKTRGTAVEAAQRSSKNTNTGNHFPGMLPFMPNLWVSQGLCALCPSKSGLMNKHIVKHIVPAPIIIIAMYAAILTTATAKQRL